MQHVSASTTQHLHSITGKVRSLIKPPVGMYSVCAWTRTAVSLTAANLPSDHFVGIWTPIYSCAIPFVLFYDLRLTKPLLRGDSLLRDNAMYVRQRVVKRFLNVISFLNVFTQK
jgi:hypothetical protein